MMEYFMLFCMYYGGFVFGRQLANLFMFSVFGRRLKIKTKEKDGTETVHIVRYRPLSYQHRFLWRLKLHELGLININKE